MIYIDEDKKECFLHCLLSLLDRRLEEEIVCIIIACITGESTLWAEAVFAAGLIEPFCKLVAIKKMGIAAVAIANAIDVFAAGLIEPFCKLVAIKKMGIAAVAIANAIDGTADDEQKKSLVTCCIDVLCNYVGDQNKWAGISLRRIEKILKLGEAKKANNGGYNVYAQQIKEDVKLEDFWTPRFKSQAKAILMTYWPSTQWPYSKSVSTHTP